MLVSPTEPKLLRDGRTVSSVPERFGVDFLGIGKVGKWGVQRKEIGDLVASLKDGRLSKELGQMRALNLAILIIEGKVQWSTDGYLLNVRSFTKMQYHGVLFSVQSQGVWCLTSGTMQESHELLIHLEKWLLKDRHGLLQGRPKATGTWGKADNREWGIHFLQSFPGIGPDTAGRIYDHFGGLPLTWDCDRERLQEIKGVGKVRAEKMIEALHSK